MDELRRLSMRFVSHHDLTAQEYALQLIAELAIRADNHKQMQGIAEMFLDMKPGGDGQ
jgi:hypothetical protein